jgi:hypothetical protein
MTDAVFFVARYQIWIYAVLGLGILFYTIAFGRASRRLGRTLFGLEKEAALQKQNGALVMLIVLVALVISVFILNRYIVPNAAQLFPTPAPEGFATPAITPTPILARSTAAPLVVDSSGCSNPDATLDDPKPNTQIAGAFEVRGTASIANFAFYTFEISGPNTNGAWVSVYVGTEPVVSGTLGSFDSSAYEPGDYAFRLVVKDNAGNFPPPCVVAVRFVPIARPTIPP